MNHTEIGSGRGKLLVIVGPTAVGKTALSLDLAKRFRGEIVSADSRLFYRGMDIGTAKPTQAEQAAVPHHLINICRPDETVTLGHYRRYAYQTIDDILARGNLPILVGGTGQYVMAVVEGWGVPEVAPDRALRRELEKLGEQELARWLACLDPKAAERIDPRNVRRVVRALEVTLISGRQISKLQQKSPPPYDIYMVGLDRERDALYEHIDRRVDQMMEEGLLEEVVALQHAGFNERTPAMSGLGYRQLLAYLDDKCDLIEAVERIKFETHRFVRQQATWFRLDDMRIHWYSASSPDLADFVAEDLLKWFTTIAPGENVGEAEL